jgi:superfamily II DNA or RNA helicase
VFYTLPTGGGKTVIFSSLIEAIPHYKVAMIAHREELLKQAQKTLYALSGIESGIIQAGNSTNPFARVQMCSIQSMRSRQLPFEPDLIIVDEAHLCKAKSYMTFFSKFEAKRLLVSATPCGLDKRGFHDVADVLIKGPGIDEMVKQGYLAPPLMYTASHIEDNLKRIKKVAGDYALNEVSALMQSVQIVGDVVEKYQEKANGRKGVVFCVDVNHSKSVAQQFNDAGIQAEHIDGSFSSEERTAILNRLKTGETTIVTNCNILCEGWDEPSISYVGLARPTKSLALYIQQAGRGLRLFEGKQDCVILDHGNNVIEHGHILETRHWTLDGKAFKEKKLKPYKECPCCASWQSKTATICTDCGYKWQVKIKEIHVVENNPFELGEARSDVEVFFVRMLLKASEKNYKRGWAWIKTVEKFGYDQTKALLSYKTCEEYVKRYYNPMTLHSHSVEAVLGRQ